MTKLKENAKFKVVKKGIKPRCSSIETQTDLRAGLIRDGDIPCPIALNARELKSFGEILASYPKDTWDYHRSRMAGQLAQMMVLSEDLQKDAELHGTWYTNDKGDFKEHPAYSAYLKSLNSIQAMSRSLGLTSAKLGIKKKDLGSQIMAERTACKSISKASKGFLA